MHLTGNLVARQSEARVHTSAARAPSTDVTYSADMNKSQAMQQH